MLLSTRIVTALMAAMPLAAAMPQQPGGEFCATDPGEEALKVHRQMLAGDASVVEKIEAGKANLMEAVGLPGASAKGRPSSSAANGAAMNFNTYVHIIQSASGTSPSNGYISKQQIDAQMRVLNQEYALANVSFNHVNTSYTVNSKWANAVYPGDDVQTEMKSRLRVGGRLDLNLFYIPTWRGSGVCRFPFWIGENDENLHIDGCMQSSDSFPDGSQNHRGFLTVHEVGHWMGLLHTFQGGCSDVEGDFVADTPAEKGPNWSSAGCPADLDTCPDLPGLDPIENHMDYSHESCKTGFTAGQAKRIRDMVLMYRYANN
ncbi:hypothetical protein LMH87_002583 [Akanthomyces muscarius]|uniref:Peptidase M43 pregnancy-associated plasma-A domain-containing protein n=1 Tax=Akanthomyces muscarius TaxID=2231603 RepID=A0A9W8Q9U9_AKAMU|nr:hypothetical protein LMH87_002583 [Akanthomyces muscarius]KAJ4148096.1 hypothetical protein LMH87_002583 [Akanthomyces muscarius]